MNTIGYIQDLSTEIRDKTRIVVTKSGSGDLSTSGNSDWCYPTSSATDTIVKTNSYISSPEIVQVPIDIYNRVLEEIKLRYDDLISFRDPQILNDLSDLIKDFENCK